MSVLKPEASLSIGLATGALVFAIHSNTLPSMADLRVSPKGDRDVDASRRQATWMSAGIVSAISLLAKDPTIFTIGGLVVVGMDWYVRHSNEVDPVIGKATGWFTGAGITPTQVNSEPVAAEPVPAFV